MRLRQFPLVAVVLATAGCVSIAAPEISEPTATPQPRRPTATMSPASNQPLVDYQKAALHIAADAPRAHVCVEGIGLRVRDQPREEGTVIGNILATDVPLYVVDGPLAADNHTWYRVGYPGISATGWQSRIGWVAGEFLTTGSDLHTCGDVDLDAAPR